MPDALVETAVAGCGSSFDVHGWADYPPGSIYRGRQSSWEFLLIEQGGMRWRLPAAERRVEAGAVCLVPGGSQETRYWSGETASRHGFIWLRFEPAAERALRKLAPDPVWPGGHSGELRILLRRLLSRLGCPGFSRPVASAELRLALTLFLERPETDLARSRDALPPIPAKALRHIHRRWREGGVHLLALAEIAAAADCTPEHLCRSFRAAFDCTPREAMQTLRLHNAVHMLSGSRLSCKQIAHELGFAEETNFARLFRRIHGLAPQEARRRLADGSWRPGNNSHLRFGDVATLFWQPEVLDLE